VLGQSDGSSSGQVCSTHLIAVEQMLRNRDRLVGVQPRLVVGDERCDFG
jgi:hypothetical protein